VQWKWKQKIIAFANEASFRGEGCIAPPKSCNTGRLPKQQKIEQRVLLIEYRALLKDARILQDLMSWLHDVMQCPIPESASWLICTQLDFAHESWHTLSADRVCKWVMTHSNCRQSVHMSHDTLYLQIECANESWHTPSADTVCTWVMTHCICR